jgi:hypothetical protein
MRPEVVDPLKEDILLDITEDLVHMAEAFGLIQWDIDHTERRIEGHLKLRVEVDDERESGR